MMSRKVPITTLIDPGDVEQLDKIARERDVSLSSLIRQAIKDFLAEMRK